MNGMGLANLVHIFHWVIILFVLFAPFVNVPSILILHITFNMSLIIHWVNNNNVCSLSLLESKLRGLDYTESLTHKFISPIYDMSKTTWSNVCYIVTILLTMLSGYLLYYSPQWKIVNTCLDQLKKSNEYMNAALLDKIKLYIECLKPLFTI